MSVEFKDHASLPAAPKGFRCPGCKRPLAMDTGVTESGMPSCWARCHPDRGGCGKTWCPHKHEIKQYDAAWEPGKTSGEGKMVGVCIEGMCQRVRVEYERMLVAFSSFPNGSEAAEAVEKLRSRRLGQEGSWLVNSANYLLAVFDWYRNKRPELRRAESEARYATVPASTEPVLSAAEWKARRDAEKAAAAEKSRRAELAVWALVPELAPSWFDPGLAEAYAKGSLSGAVL